MQIDSILSSLFCQSVKDLNNYFACPANFIAGKSAVFRKKAAF